MAGAGMLEGWKRMKAVTRLGSPDAGERQAAKSALLSGGPASIPPLRRSLSLYRVGRAQFAVASLLHQLGDPQGLPLLAELLRTVNTHGGEAEIEEALLEIPPQDTRLLLRQEWAALSDWSGGSLLPPLIASLWVKLGDPSCLDLILRDAERVPRLFLETVPQFGETAVLHLDRMLNDPRPERRVLALQALARIQTPRSFTTAARGLRDFDPQVREAAPEALSSTGGAGGAAQYIAFALEDGFASVRGLELLRSQKPLPSALLASLLDTWNPHAPLNRVDAPTLRWILRLLAAEPHPLASPALPLLARFCALLERGPSPALASALLEAVGTRSSLEPDAQDLARTVLRAHIAAAEVSVRKAAALALNAAGDPAGIRFLEMLDEGLLLKSGGAKRNRVGRMASAAISLFVGGQKREGKTVTPEDLPRFERWSVELLLRTLKALERTQDEREAQELRGSALGALEVMVSLKQRPAPKTRAALVSALGFVRFVKLQNTPSLGSLGAGEFTDLGDPIRRAADETLRFLYGSDAYALLVEAAYSLNPAVQETGIEGLVKLGETRALLPLKELKASPHRRVRESAEDAMAAIKSGSPEMMTLLRASTEADPLPHTLLRPVETSPDTPSDELLRPVD